MRVRPEKGSGRPGTNPPRTEGPSRGATRGGVVFPVVFSRPDAKLFSPLDELAERDLDLELQLVEDLRRGVSWAFDTFSFGDDSRPAGKPPQATESGERSGAERTRMPERSPEGEPGGRGSAKGRGPEAEAENETRKPGAERPERVCALVSCAAVAEYVVRHPYRPEPMTWLCALHAEYALEAGAREVALA